MKKNYPNAFKVQTKSNPILSLLVLGLFNRIADGSLTSIKDSPREDHQRHLMFVTVLPVATLQHN